ncbi:hypothetical protein EG328_006719 [Venturia inaequalis]|uniref:Restriction of telomere capping protein 4 n=2 Tax=Venturia inaequalis TaxID=5025 RepID=A0A8H3YNU2_VENIN|nr:hypothetical protein EG327_000733 [Venturia inaequalis]KAE9969666.1 hypothetical protein EG328_006719 [Venturia inaequalis]
MATRKEMDLTGLYDLTPTTTRTRSSRNSPFKVPSSISGQKTAETKRLTVPDAINGHVAPPSRLAMNIPPELPSVVCNDEKKEEPAVDADPQSSDDDEPTASADIPQTIFVRTPKKETRTRVLGNGTSSTRGNNNPRSEKERTESPDSKKAKEWDDANRREKERMKKRKRDMKQKTDKSKPFSTRISAASASASANIHAANPKKPVKKDIVVSKPASPKKKKGGLNIPSAIVPIAASPKSTLRKSLRTYGTPGTLLPTPVTTQSSPSPSPKNKRRFEDEADSDRTGKKSKRDSGFSSGSSSPLSSAPEVLDEKEVETECKFCFQEVDRTLAEMYSWPSSRPTMLQKGKYCTWHKTKEAEKEWQEKGYPTINWTKLRDKLSEYDPDVERLINEPESSHYRQALKDKTKGKIHSIARLQEDEDEDVDLELELGFYGYRGLDMMTNHITTTFHDLLRGKSAGDYVISTSARGVANYARLVLAKELATLLIRDEMKVSLERARDILFKSTSVGEVLNGKEIYAETGDCETKKPIGRVYVGWDGNEIEPTQC